jgi:hypothetical protein
VFGNRLSTDISIQVFGDHSDHHSSGKLRLQQAVQRLDVSLVEFFAQFAYRAPRYCH